MKNFKSLFITALFALVTVALQAQQPFVHRTTSSNINGHMTTLDNASVNGQSDALLFITQRYGKYNNHQAGVWYSGGKWLIYNEDKAAMPDNTLFNVMAVKASDRAFMHKATTGNIDKNWTVIDHPKCNNKPNAVILVTQNWKGTYNPKALGVWYTGSRWAIYNQDKSAMPSGTNFNVMVLEEGTALGSANVFIAKATSTTKNNSLGKYIASTGVTNTGATLFVTQNWKNNGPYNDHVEAVWHDGKAWTVYNQDKQTIPDNAKFNVVSFGGKPSNIPTPTPTPTTRPLNTVYSADGVAVMQFKYKKAGQTYNTECSVPDLVNDIDITTTTEKYLQHFAPACHQHDLNYRAPWRMAGFSGYSGKRIADEKFRKDMFKICDDINDNFVEKGYCEIVAGVWYEAVKNHGDDAFDSGQNTASNDCDASSVKALNRPEVKCKVTIDACHSDLDDTDTDNRITVNFWSGSRHIGGKYVDGLSNCGGNDTAFAVTTDLDVTHITITTNGGDALFIDELRMYKDGDLIKHEGRDDGNGWCLSTDANDANGDWSGELAGNTCRKELRFNY